MDRLFVYGSLQPGASNHHVVRDIDGEWQPASVRGRLWEAGWGAGIGYPALQLDDAGPQVPGQLLSSPRLAGHWPALDRFEGEEYRRVLAEVTLADGRRVQAHVYVVNPAALPDAHPDTRPGHQA